jgi:hypothetical protein
MTAPSPFLPTGNAGDVVGSSVAAVQSIVEQARRLGLTWRLLPGSVLGTVSNINNVAVTLDGDTVQTRAQSLIGQVNDGDRVMVMVVPPSSTYIVGMYGPSNGRFQDGCTGIQSVTFAASTSASVTVTFATPFSATPAVVCQVATSLSGAFGSTVLVTAVSATQFTMRVNLTASSSITLTVHWHAIPRTQ